MEPDIQISPTQRRGDRMRAATRHRRNLRLRRERQEREPWEQTHVPRTNSPISDELDADPKDAARLQEARQQASEGKVRFWPREDGGDREEESGVGE